MNLLLFKYSINRFYSKNIHTILISLKWFSKIKYTWIYNSLIFFPHWSCNSERAIFFKIQLNNNISFTSLDKQNKILIWSRTNQIVIKLIIIFDIQKFHNFTELKKNHTLRIWFLTNDKIYSIDKIRTIIRNLLKY